MDNWGLVSWGSMVGRGSMVGWAMSKNSLSSMNTVRRVSDSSNRSNRSSKSIGLSCASVFSLVWLGD